MRFFNTKKMKADDFKLKRFLLIDSESEHTSLISCTDDGDDGLDLEISILSDDMIIQNDSEKEMFELLMERMISSDGQIVRFCDYVIRTLTDKCSSFYYGNNEFQSEDPEDSDLFNDKTASYHIPKMISELSDRLHDEIKEQVFSENKDL